VERGGAPSLEIGVGWSSRLERRRAHRSGRTRSSIAGFQTPLPQSTLQGLYKNDGQYISAVNHDLQQLTSEGWWPAQYTQPELRADALSYANEFLSPAATQS
jgi:hypothetical protein